MKIKKTILLTVLLLPFFWSDAQTNARQVNPPKIHVFAPILQFLASPALEGRETGNSGASIAADYIASMMCNMGLTPYQRTETPKQATLSDYYQTFRLLRFWPDKYSVTIGSSEKAHKPLQLLPYSDYTVENAFQSFSIHSTPFFAGYGINSADLDYNDYAKRDVKGRLVIILDGYPGQHDTTSLAWNKFKSFAQNDGYDLDMKCIEASRQGAAAIMIIKKDYLQFKPANAASAKEEEPVYEDAEYLLQANSQGRTVPCFLLTETGCRKLSDALKTNFINMEQNIARQLKYEPLSIKNVFNVRLQSKSDTIMVHNIIGILKGRDTTQTVIIGAHYDHLGKRGNTIYYGSDDNASGAAGLLALAEMWTESHAVPPCNIAFASWTAEEKGLLGSEYFVSTLTTPKKVKLYINMDMISRSVKEDTARRQLSIGTRTSDKYIRDFAQKINTTIHPPFVLDLWDVTGHSGSDYASFTAKNIPIMTYNTGLHDDYHTPRDISENADLIKMCDVLKVVNESLQEVLENFSGE